MGVAHGMGLARGSTRVGSRTVRGRAGLGRQARRMLAPELTSSLPGPWSTLAADLTPSSPPAAPALTAGTLDYMAPEVLRCPPKNLPQENKNNPYLHYNNSVDAWAVGVFAYELVVGFPPFAGRGQGPHVRGRVGLSH